MRAPAGYTRACMCGCERVHMRTFRCACLKFEDKIPHVFMHFETPICSPIQIPFCHAFLQPIQYDGPRTLEGLIKFTKSDGKEGNAPGGAGAGDAGEEEEMPEEEEEEEPTAEVPEMEGEGEDVPLEASDDDTQARDEL